MYIQSEHAVLIGSVQGSRTESGNIHSSKDEERETDRADEIVGER